MKMKRLLAMLLALTLVVMAFAACDSGDDPAPADDAPAEEAPADDADDTEEAPAADGDMVVYGIYKAGDQTWFIDEGEAAEKAVKADGGEFIYVDAKMDAEEYMRAIDNAIANNADGIVTCPVDQQMSQAIVDKTNEAGIPIVAADDALEIDGEKLAPWVGIDAYVIGESCGQWMSDYATEHDLLEGENTAILILTMDTVTSVVPRAEGAFDKFTELQPDYPTDRIFKADYNGETDKAYDAAQAIFTAHPEVTHWIVSAPNDEGAVGAVRALEQVGIEETSAVIGIGAYLAKDEWNHSKESAFRAAAWINADDVGRMSIEVLMDMIDGNDVEMEQAIPATIVTADNYEELMGDAAK